MTLKQILKKWRTTRGEHYMELRRPHWGALTVRITPDSYGSWSAYVYYDGNFVASGEWRPSISDAIAEDWEVVG